MAMKTFQLRFLRNEFLTLSLLGAFERSNTYSASAPEDVRAKVRHALRSKLEDVASRYKHPVDDSTHANNICEVADAMTAEFAECLRGGRFRIGIAQNCLNLYLKYLWCVGDIPAPPHCPFDATIIARLPNRQQLKWTALDAIQDYMALVEAARAVAGSTSLAEWELKEWKGA
jgi:hypothetical protein